MRVAGKKWARIAKTFDVKGEGFKIRRLHHADEEKGCKEDREEKEEVARPHR
jgi:hypothetical protein